MSNRILITGATGFIGSALTARLAADPDNQIAVLVRPHYQGERLPDPLQGLTDRIVVVYGDLRDYQETRRAVMASRPQVIYHLAAAGVSDPFLPIDVALEHNLNTTLNLLRAAFDEWPGSDEVRRFVVVRTPGEKSAMNPYAAAKASAWQFCAMLARTQERPLVGIMPYQTYGPGQPDHLLVGAAFAAAMAGTDFPMTAGKQQRDWIYIEDVVGGLAAAGSAALEPGVTVELGTGTLTSVANVVQKVYDLVGGDGRPQIGALPSRPGEDPVQVADVAQAQARLDWAAQVNIDEGLARTYEFLQRRRP